ncbi:hypothetical protein BIW11_02459 [Tropilaelaps mercedesae]|uniref:Uncharacterized protein n=1 Tax=Tropilaelaps mercedesae TaxID=418985 RepID=A0A1V9Y2S1_9ACAR|nr:hypothetical protein BIW11_02459 [Tropilaelaps mercedesae]
MAKGRNKLAVKTQDPFSASSFTHPSLKNLPQDRDYGQPSYSSLSL